MLPGTLSRASSCTVCLQRGERHPVYRPEARHSAPRPAHLHQPSQPFPLALSGCLPGVGCSVGARQSPHAACLPQVGEEAYFSVKSTRPCDFTLYYEVAARGNIVLSGQQPAHITQQRSKRATPALEKPIRLTHLSETGEPGSREKVPVFASEILRLGWVPQRGKTRRDPAEREAQLGTEGTCPQ